MPFIVCIAGVCFTVTPGVIVGTGLTFILLIYLLLPLFSRSEEHTYRNMMKKAVILLEKMKIMGHEVRDVFEDITAEARAEITEKRKAELAS